MPVTPALRQLNSWMATQSASAGVIGVLSPRERSRSRYMARSPSIAMLRPSRVNVQGLSGLILTVMAMSSRVWFYGSEPIAPGCALAGQAQPATLQAVWYRFGPELFLDRVPVV